MKASTAFLLCLLSGAASAQDITVKLTPQEAQVAITLWDAGLKALGGPAAEAYTVLSRKVQAAQQEAAKPPVVEAKPPATEKPK